MSSKKKTILLCHGTGCIASGAVDIKGVLVDRIEKSGIKDVQVKLTGCHGFCQRGPIVIVEPEGIFYSEVNEQDAAQIVEQHLVKSIPVERLFYKHPQTGSPIAHYKDIPFYSRQQPIILRNCGHINPEDIDDYLATGGV